MCSYLPQLIQVQARSQLDLSEQVYPIHQVKRQMSCYSLIFHAKELCTHHTLQHCHPPSTELSGPATRLCRRAASSANEGKKKVGNWRIMSEKKVN